MKNLRLVFMVSIILALICLAYLPVTASTEKVEIVFQHNNTEDHPWHQGALYMQKALDERSNGRIKV